MERELTLELIRVTEAAAIAAGRTMGRGAKELTDQVAVDAMRSMFDSVQIEGTVVIGEGEMDEAPMLYIGERVGSGGDVVDIAVDPVEGTSLVSHGLPGAITVLAVGPKGTLLSAPDMYMDKIAVGPKAKGSVRLGRPIQENLAAVADALGKAVRDLTVVCLDRDRHRELIADMRKAGARIKLIEAGDVAPAVDLCFPETGIDMLVGSGGGPEGVLAAAALKCLGGDFQGRLLPSNQEEEERAKAMGIKDVHRVLTIDELVQGEDVIFAATGVTEGDLLRGVRYTPSGAKTHSLVMRSKTGTVRFVEADHRLDRKPYLIKE